MRGLPGCGGIQTAWGFLARASSWAGARRARLCLGLFLFTCLFPCLSLVLLRLSLGLFLPLRSLRLSLSLRLPLVFAGGAVVSGPLRLRGLALVATTTLRLIIALLLPLSLSLSLTAVLRSFLLLPLVSPGFLVRG